MQVVTLAWCAFGSWVSLKMTSAVVALCLSVEGKREGLDVSQHGDAMEV